MRERKFKIGDLVWFTKSMRMCEVVGVYNDGYAVARIDTRKELFATERGLRHVDEPLEVLPNDQ